MKTVLVAVVSLSVVGLAGLLLTQRRPLPAPVTPQSPSPASTHAGTRAGSPAPARNLNAPLVASKRGASTAQPAALGGATATPTSSYATVGLAIHPAFPKLLDPQASYSQKQEVWGQLRAAGKLDAAMTELEQQAKEDGTNPAIPASLGQAYLHKAGSIQDIREQGILGMKADQAFDAALTLDSRNWEARFWKATAMSYWPPQLGKTTEVMQHLATLVEQQETATPRPEFVQAYVLLGEQYRKNGYADHAKQIWQRGSATFPNDPSLQQKLASVQ